MERRAEIIIIGGGIVGTSIAYYLAQKKARGVVLLEKGMLGEGSTAKCAGGIRAQFSTEINIRFSLESFKTWNRFEEITGIDLGFKRVGYLFLATSEDEWGVFRANADLQHQFDIPAELLSPQEFQYRWPYLRVDDLQGGTFCSWEGYAGSYGADKCRELKNSILQKILNILNLLTILTNLNLRIFLFRREHLFL